MNTDQQPGPVPVFYIAPQWQVPDQQQGLVAAQYYPQHMYPVVQPQIVETPQDIPQETPVEVDASPAEGTEIPKPTNRRGRRCICCFGKKVMYLICAGMVLTAFILSIIAVTKRSTTYYYNNGGYTPAPTTSYSMTGTINGSLSEMVKISPFVAVSTYGGEDPYYTHTVGYGQEVAAIETIDGYSIDSASQIAHHDGDQTVIVSISKSYPNQLEGVLLNNGKFSASTTYTPGVSGSIQKIIAINKLNNGLRVTYMTAFKSIYNIRINYSIGLIQFDSVNTLVTTVTHTVPVVQVAAFNTTAIAIWSYDDAVTQSSVNLALCTADYSTVRCSVVPSTNFCLKGSSILPLQSTSGDSIKVSFLMSCNNQFMNYTYASSFASGQFERVDTQYVSIPGNYNYQFYRVDNKTAIAYAVQGRTLYARIIRTGYHYETYYKMKYQLTVDNLVTIAADVASQVQVNHVNGQVFFTYQTINLKYVTVPAGIVGVASKLLDVADERLELESLSGQTSKPIIVSFGTYLMYAFPFTSQYVRKVTTMRLTVRGGVRPVGVVAANAYYSGSRSNTIYFGNKLYSTSALVNGRKYYAKKNGEVSIDRRSELGSNHYVGRAVESYYFMVDIA